VRRNTVITERMDLLAWLRKQLAEADTDLLREMVRCFAETLMGAEADALCGQVVVGDRMATSV
jgi:transposase-like protein